MMNVNRKKRRGRKKDLNLLLVIQQFFKKEEVAAEFLGVSSTTLKNYCRDNGVKRWPFRKLVGHLNTKLRLHTRLKQESDGSRFATLRELQEVHSKMMKIVNPREYVKNYPAVNVHAFSFQINNGVYTLNDLVNPNFIPPGFVVPTYHSFPSQIDPMNGMNDPFFDRNTPPQMNSNPLMAQRDINDFDDGFSVSTDSISQPDQSSGVLPSFQNVCNNVVNNQNFPHPVLRKRSLLGNEMIMKPRAYPMMGPNRSASTPFFMNRSGPNIWSSQLQQQQRINRPRRQSTDFPPTPNQRNSNMFPNQHNMNQGPRFPPNVRPSQGPGPSNRMNVSNGNPNFFRRSSNPVPHNRYYQPPSMNQPPNFNMSRRHSYTTHQHFMNNNNNMGNFGPQQQQRGIFNNNNNRGPQNMIVSRNLSIEGIRNINLIQQGCKPTPPPDPPRMEVNFF